MSDKGKAFGAAAIGIALGAAVGLLLAPASGRRTRRRLVQVIGDGRDAVVRGGDYLMDQGKRIVNG
jgi:gas vesicle protein